MKTILNTLLVSVAALAASTAAAQVKVENPWVRATVPQQQATGAFMNLTAEKDTKLVEARSSVLPAVEVHEMTMENDVMKMRQIQSLELPAGKTVELKPGGYHIMFMNLKDQIKEGDTVPLTLVFENSDGTQESVEVQAPVRALTTGGHGNHGKNAHKH